MNPIQRPSLKIILGLILISATALYITPMEGLQTINTSQITTTSDNPLASELSSSVSTSSQTQRQNLNNSYNFNGGVDYAKPLGSTDNPARSCNQIAKSTINQEDGEYWIDPEKEGVTPFKVYCSLGPEKGWIKLRIHNDCNNDNMFWYSKYSGIDDQESTHGKIGQQFNWSLLPQLENQTDLLGPGCSNSSNQEGFDYVLSNSIEENITVEWESWGSGNVYTQTQMDAVRETVEVIHPDTEAFAHTNDDDNCDPNGEVDLKNNKTGPEYRITHFTSGNQESDYAIETEKEMMEYRNVDYLIPSYIDIRNDGNGCSGEVDHGSWGFEQNYTLVRSNDTEVSGRVQVPSSTSVDKIEIAGMGDSRLQNFSFNAESGWSTGKIGNTSLKFDGTDYVETSDSKIPTMEKGLTVAAWIKLDTYGPEGNGNIVAKGKNDAYRVRVESDGEFWMLIGNNTGHTILRGGNVPLDQWTHVTAVADSGNQIRLYVNGEQVAQKNTAKTIGQNTNPLYIGSQYEWDEYLNGKIDDLRIYKRPLTSKEVQNIKNGGNNPEDLVGRWNFEAGNGTTAFNTANLQAEGILATKGLKSDKKIQGLRKKNSINTSANYTISTWIKSGRDTANPVITQSKYNGIKYSENFTASGTAWQEYCGSSTTNSNITAPDGTETAYRIDTKSGNYCDTSRGRIQLDSPAQGKTYTVSIWARGENGGENFKLGIDDYQECGFSLTTEWRRYKCAKEKTGQQPTRGMEFYSTTENATYYAWGAQRTPGKHAGPYTETKEGTIRTQGANLWTERGSIIYRYRTSSETATTKTAIPANRWKNIAITHTENQEIGLYIDGEERDTAKISENARPQEKPVIAAVPRQPVQTFEGKIDEIQIYNRSLDSIEIEKLAFN